MPVPVDLNVDAAGTATVLLNRPAKRNALDRAMLDDLRAAITAIRHRDDVRAVILRGAGGTFCAGADIADWAAPTPAVARELSALGRDTFTELAALPVPSVALIEGTAVGGGLELALACDIRLATAGAVLGFPELRLGNLPAWGGLARLVALTGLGPARHLLLTGNLISGTRAAELNVVTGDAGELDEIIAGLLACEPFALALAKDVLSEFDRDTPLEPALAAHFALLDSSRQRKQDFLDRKAARRAAATTGIGAPS